MLKSKILLVLFSFILFSCEAVVSFDDDNNTNNNNTNNNNSETVCDDGVDNDGDGFTDCEDQDCNNAPLCMADPGSCTIQTAFDPTTGSEGCNDQHECIIENDNNWEDPSFLYVTISGARCVPAQEINAGYFGYCDVTENCPKTSICVANVCLPLYTDNYQQEPCEHAYGSLNLNQNDPDWHTWFSSSTADYIRYSTNLDTTGLPNPPAYCFLENISHDFTQCDIISGTYYLNNFSLNSNIACKVVITSGNAIISSNSDSFYLTAGLTPVFGNKQQEAFCKSTEECAPGFVCSSYTASSQGKCRQICTTSADCTSVSDNLSCTAEFDVGNNALTFQLREDTNIYGVCAGVMK